MLVIQIASGILLALAVLGVLCLAYKALRWTVRKGKNRKEEEKYVNALAAQMKLDREGDADWLSSGNKKT